jgi:hypothetical protein
MQVSLFRQLEIGVSHAIAWLRDLSFGWFSVVKGHRESWVRAEVEDMGMGVGAGLGYRDGLRAVEYMRVCYA